ncbi:MAG: DUF3267 domain-containing protein [Chloroflexi bacterium]|nr:DUF3267 domain-containing protein [Chloroflexota bacterium]
MSQTSPGAVPSDYREALYWKVTGNPRRSLAVNLLGLPLLAISGPFFFWFASRFGRLPAREDTTALELLALLASILLTLMLHELAHGSVMRLYGARPQYGVLLRALAFYATAPGYGFTRNQYLTLILAPLVSLSLLAAVGIVALAGSPIVALLAACASLNAAGASGDVWMAVIVARYPAHAYVIDERDGMRIFLPA